MNEEQIKTLIRQEVQAAASGGRFGLTSIPRHIHNNTDSPFVFMPVVNYAGSVFSDATMSTPFPKGWLLSTLGTGVYRIVHNLDSLYYSVSITPVGNAIVPTIFAATLVNPDVNQFDVLMYDTATQANVDCDFFFLVTMVNNKKTVPPLYN